MLLSNRLRFFSLLSSLTVLLFTLHHLPPSPHKPSSSSRIKTRIKYEQIRKKTQHPSFIIISLFQTRKKKKKHDGIENYYINFELGIFRKKKTHLSV
jgi:hypothetical protein